ncbi:MAG: diacylglycerol kinase family protein [Clostridia bacterium]|nr:diacylglycerol kinase family protein [Clostridia bacterium]
MTLTYLLYNPLSGNETEEEMCLLESKYAQAVRIDLTRIGDYAAFFRGLEPEDDVILCGGDGTINRFVNELRGVSYPNRVYLYAAGSGNDFARDLGHARLDAPTYPINEAMASLPVVTVNGDERLFVNGIGYGIDGYCCEKGDELREKRLVKKRKKPINYTMIAIRGLLYDYRPRKATVTVDGKDMSFKKVWLAPVMNGRYYGGGMMPTPSQDRFAEKKTLSIMVFHDVGILRTLMIFPSLFKGEHIKHTKVVTILEGETISVAYDRPAPLQIDGETVKNVSKFTTSVCRPASV